MKSNPTKALLAILLMVGFSSIAGAQKIVIEEFKDTIYYKFNDKNDITSDVVKKSFTVQILKSAGIQKIEVKYNKGFAFQGISSTDTPYDYYILSDSYYDKEDSLIEIKIYKEDANFKMIKIKVIQKEAVELQTETELQYVELTNSDCIKPVATIALADESGKCKAKVLTNSFDEDATFYHANTITYLYDFNPDLSKRRIYKITKNRSGGLDVSLANFSTEKLKPKNEVYVKVVNINKFLYDISIADTMVSYESEPSSLFTQLFLGDSNLLGKLLRSYTANITQLQSAKSKKNSFENALSKKIFCFLSNYNGMQAKMLQAYNPCSSFPCCNGITEDYLVMANSLLEIKINMALLFQNTVDKKSSQLKEKNESIKACEKTNTDLDANQKARDPIEKKKETERSDPEKTTLTNLLKVKEALEKNKCADETLANYKKQAADLETELKTYSSITELQSKLPGEQELRKLVVFINNMVEQNNSHLIGPTSVKGNRLELTINIKSRDSITKYFSIPAYNNDPIHLDIPVIWKGFISFSTGSFIGIHERLKNKTYEWQQVPNINNTVLDTAKFVLAESGYTAPPMGFAALGSIEWKATGFFGIGLSVGVGLTIEREPRPVYLAGGSLFFGDLRQFALTGGIAGMQVNKLKNNLQAVVDQNIRYATKQTIEYFKEFKIGAFISLTYTPFKTSKKR